ncbi:MAG: alpha/beta hydrolase family protein [Spirochaetota bacterium]
MRRLVLLATVALLAGCATTEYVFHHAFPTLEIHRHDGGYLYESKPAGRDTVVIWLSGGRLGSVLGTNNEGRVRGGGFWSALYEFGDAMTVVAPERPNARPGTDHEFDDVFLRSYTIDNLVAEYARMIDHYLDRNRTENVYMMGRSEGSLVLPAVYLSLENKERIDRMVSLFGGGMSPPEYYRIDNDLGPGEHFELWWQRVEENPDSIEHAYHRLTYRYLTSWLGNSPLDAYRRIDVPVLFVHGMEDTRVPVQSTQVVESELPEKPFEYWYAEDMGHGPATREESIALLERIETWLLQDE